MLDKFKWDEPVRTTGSNATPFIKLTCRFPGPDANKRGTNRDNADKIQTKYSFTLSKGFAKDFDLEGKIINIAFSFDKEDELMMATDAPDTIPSYPARETTGSSYVFQNARFAQMIFTKFCSSEEEADKEGTYHIFFDWREELPRAEGKLKLFNLIRRQA